MELKDHGLTVKEIVEKTGYKYGSVYNYYNGFDKKSLKKSLKGVATNPIIWGIFIGMIISVVRIELPFIVNKTMHNFSVLATPLALIGLGAGFEGRKALAKIKQEEE